MTFTFKLDLDNVKVNQHVKCHLIQSYCLDTDTQQADCSTWTTKAVGKIFTPKLARER